MQNSIWKLTALAGVIGATCLVVLLLRQKASEVPLVVTTVDPSAVLGDSQTPPARPAEQDQSVPIQSEPGQAVPEADDFQPFPEDQDSSAVPGIDFREPTNGQPSGASAATAHGGVAESPGAFPVISGREPEFAASPADTTHPTEPNPFELVGAEAAPQSQPPETGGSPPTQADRAAPASATTGPVLLASDEALPTTPDREPPGLIFRAAGDRPARSVAQPVTSNTQPAAFDADAEPAPTTDTADPPGPYDRDPLPIPTAASSIAERLPNPDAFQPFADGELDVVDPATSAASEKSVKPSGEFPTLELFESQDGPAIAADDVAAPAAQEPAQSPTVTATQLDNGPSIGSPAPLPATAPQPLTPATSAQPLAGESPAAILGDGTIAGDTAEKILRPQLKIEKKAPSKAVLGQPLIYHILVNNVGTTTASAVLVEDRIPKGTKLTGTIPRAELVDGRLMWRLGKLEPGKQSKISVRVIPIAEGQIGSVATVTSVAEVATRTQIVAPKLKIEVSSNQRVRIGDSIVCNFTVSNDSDVEATNVWIRNVIPEGLRHPDGQDLEHKIGRLGPGGSYEIQLTLQAVSAGQRVNNITVTADGGISVNTKSTVDVQPNRLILARSGPAKRYVGRMALYENRVTNKSSELVTNTTIVEQLPDGMEFVEASHSGTFDQNNRTVSWDFEQLNPQESRTVSLKLLPQKIGKKTSVVQVIESSGGKSQTVSHTQVTGFASLGLDVSEVNRPMAVGEQVRLTVRTRNRGTSPATNVQVRFRIPTEFELLEVTADKRPVKFSRDGDLIKLEPIGKLPGHSQSDFEVLLRARAAARTRLRFEIVANELSQALGRDEAILIFQDQP
ncbi:MAG: hypothetical protein ABGZ17_25965 [Planctomycetaceae bacterium]